VDLIKTEPYDTMLREKSKRFSFAEGGRVRIFKRIIVVLHGNLRVFSLLSKLCNFKWEDHV
jgi:hypothetical protein